MDIKNIEKVENTIKLYKSYTKLVLRLKSANLADNYIHNLSIPTEMVEELKQLVLNKRKSVKNTLEQL